MKRFERFLFAAGALLMWMGLLEPARAAYPLPIPARPERFPLLGPQELGTVVGWGGNDGGQISTPANLGKCLAIAAGRNFSLAIKADRTIAAWGTNDWGQCSVPAGISNVVAIAAGSLFGVALRSDGSVVQWGAPYAGVAPVWLDGVVGIAAGGAHVLALKQDGSVVSWGDNGSRQTEVPPQVRDARAVSGGSSFSNAVLPDGRVIRWGGSSSPRPPTFAARDANVEMSYGAAYLLRENGEVTYFHSERTSLMDVRAISARGNQLAAIYGDARFVWLEDGTTGFRGGVTGSENTLMVSCGDNHTLALRSAGPARTSVGDPHVAHGFLVGINVADGGNNYIEPPAVYIEDRTGSGATAVAEISQGVVTGIRITNAGRGYSSEPVVRIASPWVEPTVTVTSNLSRYKVTADLIPLRRYVLERSADLVNWTSAPFVAETTEFALALDPLAPAQFIRLVRLPEGKQVALPLRVGMSE